MSYTSLQRYLIPEDIIAEEAVSDKALARGAYLFCGALLAMPFVAAGLHFVSDKLAKMSKQRKETMSKPQDNVSSTKPLAVSVSPHLEALNTRHAVEVKKEMQDRMKFLQTVVTVIKHVGAKHKCAWFKFETGRLEAYIASIKSGNYNPDSFSYKSTELECDYLVDALPAIHPNASSYDPEWAWNSNYSVELFSYDIWSWVDAHPECTNARDFDQSAAFWKEQDQIIAEFVAAFKSSDFFYSIASGGDWDDGAMEIILKPSDRIIAIATRETKYPSWPKAPKK